MVSAPTNLKDVIREGRKAYKSGEYISAAEKAIWVLRLSNSTETDSKQDCVTQSQSAAELIKDALLKLSENCESHSDEFAEILPSCKMMLLHYDTVESGDINEQTMNDIERSLGVIDPSWKDERTLLLEYTKLSHDQSLDRDISEEQCRILTDLANANSKRLPDKVSLLKACLFLRAALENAKKVNSSKILKELRNMHRKVLRLSEAKSASSDLYEISLAIQKKLSSVQQSIEAGPANEDVRAKRDSPSEQEDFEKYFSKMKNLSTSIADNYADVLKEVSSRCVSILGEPPCKFSHFSMGMHGTGDFPRTHDLMSGILLEKNAKKKENISAATEYFRWYSVIFQIIMYSGNIADLHLSTPSNEKAYDKSPTKNIRTHPFFYIDDVTAKLSIKSFIDTDSIKIVSDMVKTASPPNHDEEIARMLCRTRHFGGNDSIHKKFKKRLRKIAYSKGPESDGFITMFLKPLTKIESQDLSYHGVLLQDQNMAKISDFTVWSSISNNVFDFVYALGHLAHIEKNSAFSIAHNLVSKGFIDNKAGCGLKAALAISSEIIMKMTSSLCSASRCEDSTACVNVEKQKRIKLLVVYSAIQKVKNVLLNTNGNVSVIKSLPMEVEDICEKAEILCHFEWYSDALESLESASTSGQERSNPALELFLKGLCLTKLHRLDDANTTLKRSLVILASLPEVDQSKIFPFIQYLLGMNHLKIKKFKEANDHLEQAKKAFKARKDIVTQYADELYLQALDGLGESKYHLELYQAAYSECVDLLDLHDSMSTDHDDIVCKVLTRQINCLFRLGNFAECVRALKSALERAPPHRKHYKTDEPKIKNYATTWLVQLADCYFRLNQIGNADKCCQEAMKFIEGDDRLQIVAQLKLISAQCHLWQDRGVEASKDARDAIINFFQANEDYSNILGMIQTAVTVISRSISPIVGIRDKRYEKHTGVSDQGTVSNAMQAFSALCQQNIFTGNELQRDKSVLFRVIQTGLYKTKNYSKILDICKFYAEANNTVAIPVTSRVLKAICNDEVLRDECVRDSEYFCEASKFCNIRDAFSISGAIIVFCGSLFRCKTAQEAGIMTSLKEWLSTLDSISRGAVLHCCVKISKYMVEHFLNTGKDSNVSTGMQDNVPFLDFIGEIYEILKLYPDSPNDLLHETASLTVNVANCSMRYQNYEKALNLLNDALGMQEKLALDITSVVYIDSNTIIQNIGICLAKLGRWEEANSYLNRGSAIKERRRKSRAYEDYSMIHARVKSARCSFSLGNYQEAVFMASTAFQDGLVMDSIDNHDDSMVSAVGIVLRSTLAVSAHAETNKSQIKADIISEILNRANNMRMTLEQNCKALGGAYAETVESFYYACGNCMLVLEQYKQAVKSFKKSLKIMKQKQVDFAGMKQPITLNIAKCLIGLSKFKKAEKYLNQFLETEQGRHQATLHLHPCHAYLLLSVCSLRRMLLIKAYERASRSLYEALSTESDILKQQITKECANIYIQLLRIELRPLDLD